MTTLVAVPHPDGIELTVSPPSATVTRLDANGLRVVRRPANSPSTWIDYEAPLLGGVRYIAVDPTGADASVTVVSNGTGPQVRRVFEPGVVVRPIVQDMPATASLTATEHTIINRADTIFTTYGYGKRRGTIRYACSTYGDAVALRKLYAPGTPVLLRFPEYGAADLYHIGTDRSEQMDELAPVKATPNEPRFMVIVTYAEVEPSALTTIAAWLLRDMDSEFTTLAGASLPFATLGDQDTNTRLTP